jgi:hypothetical protein
MVDRGTDDTTFLENVTVRDFTNAGIYADGTVTIRQGVVSTGNQAIGLVVGGHAIIAVSAGQVPTSFSGNSTPSVYNPPGVFGEGISVGYGSVTIAGVPGVAAGTGTVLVNGNATFGIEFANFTQGRLPPQSVVDGLVVYGNGGGGYYNFDGAGVAIYGGANVKMRNSVSLGNRYGVMVLPYNFGVGRNDNDISHVDLGTTNILDGGAADWGINTLQAAPDAGQNLFAGLCVALDPASGTLAAAGNTFAGPRDCSGASPGTLSASRGQCTGGVDVAMAIWPYGPPDGGLLDAAAYDSSATGFAGNDIDVSNCTK